jgi:hypothetical protein
MTRPAVPRENAMPTPQATPPRRFDRHFRWRGTNVSRLEGFTDAVFAIVLALLFLRAAPPTNFDELDAAMRALVPFAASFAIIARAVSAAIPRVAQQ